MASEVEPLIYLAHRIPFPPDKGDKIRSYNVLRFLAARYRIHLGTFVDDEADWRHVPVLEEMCQDVLAVGLRPVLQRVRSATGLVRGEALSLPYYRSRTLKSWVDIKLRDEHITRVVSFSSPMAQYVPMGNRIRSVVDFVDVDSEKWRQYAARKPWPVSSVYRREANRLLEYESDVAGRASAIVFVTAEEASLFRERAPEASNTIHVIGNGVDTEYFSPARDYGNPFGADELAIVFTGRMDYWANVDGVDWFAREIFPMVRDEHRNATFYIVGACPTPGVRRLASLPGIEVTGTVDDTRPYLAHARVAIAPLRIARGIQNKVLEALSMGCPTVATSAAIQGLSVPSSVRSLVADGASELATKVSAAIRAPQETGAMGRKWAQDHHDWSQTLKPFERLIS